MAKRTRNGWVDPLVTRRVGASQKKGQRRSSDSHSPRGFKDDAKTSKTLQAINREYLDKELVLASSIGPSSAPTPHYPKSFFLKPKKEDS
jgi:hypothetical protein